MADDYSINAKITADASGFKKGIADAQKASQSLSKSVSGMIQGLGKSGLVGALGAVGLATGGVTAVLGVAKKAFQTASKVVNECSEAYRKQYQVEVALETAVNNSPYVDGTATRALKEYASEIQRVSNLGDEEILPMMTKLIASGRTQAETMDIIRVATDMSADGTVSFETAVSQLNMTLNGNIGRLGMQNAELKNLTEEELKNGKAVEILGNKYKGLAEATADTSKQLKNAIGDLKENIGKTFETALAPMRKYFTEVITNLNSAITKARDLKDAMKDAFKGDDVNVDASTDSLSIAFNEVLHKQQEATKNYMQYIQLYGKYIDEATDETAQAYKKQIKDLNAQLKTISEELNKRRKESEAEKKARSEAEAQAQQEKEINDLKQKYLDKIAEQEARWSNINLVTGEAVKKEEKLKFYQDQLVSIMTEAGGKITEQNQYYKDQMAIIEGLKEVHEEIQEDTEDALEDSEDDVNDYSKNISKAFNKLTDQIKEDALDWSDAISNVYNTLTSTFADVFTQVGESLVEGGKGFKEYAGMAVKALAQVLKGLGEQLLAIGAVNLATKQYASASVALAGAAAAFLASGVLSGIASAMQDTSSETKEASNQIGTVGEVASQSTMSLDEFIEKLKNIKGLFTGTSVSLLQTFKGLNSQIPIASQQLQNARNALIQYEQANRGAISTAKQWEWLLTSMDEDAVKFRMATGVYMVDDIRQEAVRKYVTEPLAQYNALIQQVNDMATAYAKATGEVRNLIQSTLSSYNASIQESRQVVQNYYDVLGAEETAIELRKQWNALSAQEQLIDIQKLQSNSADLASTLSYQLELYEGYAKTIVLEQKLNIQQLTTAVYTELSKTGASIGSTLVKSIISGATKEDFLNSMKDYIKENLIQIAVYTEAFEDRLSEIGAKLSRALLGLGEDDIKDIRDELEDLWNETEKRAKQAGDIIHEVFADIETSVTMNIKSFGTEISNTLVDSLTNGLGQSGFIDSMKNFIRKMLIQTLVYTESMQAEIESIGNAISKGIREGFTETTLHEVRRDMSWTFEQANATLDKIDTVLGSVFSGYASGTNNATAGLHLVGEAGPELVRFRGGEQVYNNAETRQMMRSGSSANTFNVTFQNTKDTTAFAMVQQLKQYNRQMAINGVI